MFKPICFIVYDFTLYMRDTRLHLSDRRRLVHFEQKSQKRDNYTHAGDVLLVADALGQQTIPNLPGEDGRTLALILSNAGHHVTRGYPGLAPPNGPRSDGTGLVIAA